MSENLITVVMPVYNCIKYLPSAINSILNQSEQRFILIIIDDGSTDGSTEYLKSIISHKVRTYYPGRQGLVATLNFGLSLVETPYVAIMDADDISHPLRFERQLAFFETHKNVSLVGTSIEYIGEDDNGRSLKIKMPSGDVKIKKGLQQRRFVIVHPTIMVKSGLFKVLNGYLPESFPNPDFNLFLRASSSFQFANISDIFCKIRFHKESHTFEMFPFIIKELFVNEVDGIKEKNNGIISTYFRRMRVLINTFSLKTYRYGILNYVNNKILSGIVLIILAGIINPVRGINFLKSKLVVTENSNQYF